MLSMFEIKKLLTPDKDSTPEDDFRVIQSWAEYDDSSSKTPEHRNLEYLCYELEIMNPDTGERMHCYKAIKFARVIRLPASAKQSTAFMDMQEQVLAGVHDRNYNFITIIANMLKPVSLGLLYLYGVQGVSEDLEEAKKKAHNDFLGFVGMMQGTFRVLEMKIVEAIETEWLREKMYNMDYLTMVRGIPKASKSGENMGNRGIGNQNINPDAQGTLEEIVAGMADYEYVMEILSTPVYMDTLMAWQRISQKEMTEWYGQLQGTKSLSASLSIPMMYMANASQSQGFSKAYTDANTVSYSQGENFSTSQGQSVGESLSQTFGQTVGHTEGMSLSDSVSHGITNSQGVSFGESFNQSHGFNAGYNEGTNQGINAGMSDSVNSGINQGISQNQSTSLTQGQSRTQSHGFSQGSSYNLGESQNVSQSHSIGHNQSIGYNQSESVNIGNSASYGQSASSSLSQSMTESWGNSKGHTTGMNEGYSASYGQNYGVNSGDGSSWNGSGNMNAKVLGAGLGFGHNWSDGLSWGENSSENFSNSLSESFSNSLSHTQGGSVSSGSTLGSSVSLGESISHGQSFGQSVNYGASESYGTTVGQGISQSWGVNQSENISESIGQNISLGNTYGTGQSLGTSYSQGQSRNLGESFGKSQGQSIGESIGNSYGQNVGRNMSVSESHTIGQTLGQSVSNSVSESASTGYGQNVGRSESVSNGNSYTTSNGSSKGTSTGSSGTTSMGTSSSMGLGPSIGYTKSYQWLDQGVKDLLELMEYQNERIKKALRGQGAFYTYVYIACPNLDALSTAQAIAKSTWQNEMAMVQPLQVLDLSETEQKHLLYHFAAFSADVTKEDVFGVEEYKYCTVLLPEEFVAYTHLPRISEGGVYSIVQDIPKFSVPSMLKGEIYVGTILNPERFTFKNGYRTSYDYRIDESMLHHAYFTGASRSGKSVTAMRVVAELSRVRRKLTGKRLRIVVMDPKQDWRTLSRFVEPERFNFYSMGNVNFRPVKINPWKIPKGVWPQLWIDGIIDIYCRAYGLLERGKQMLGDVIYELYDQEGVMQACDKSNWKEIVPELSARVNFTSIYKRMEEKKTEAELKGRAGNDTKDAYARLLDRLSCFNRAYSIERRLYGTSEGIGVDELIGEDEVTVLESKGLENTFKNFIFGAITSGFYKFALAHEGGYLAEDQYETVLVIEEANEVLTGNDAAGTGGGKDFGMSGQSEFEQILDQSAGYGLFIFAITQKIADMPSSIVANSGLVFAGRLKRTEDINVVVRGIGREERIDDRDTVKWFPRCPTGYFVCQTSRTFDFKDAEPILVQVSRLNINPPSNQELDEILLRKEAMAQLAHAGAA